MHYYKKNIGDYAKKAGRLSILQHGVYTLLIDACYDREKFPSEEEAIDWTWASTKEEIEAVKFVLKKFFKEDDNGIFIQKRIQEEVDQYRKNSETNKRIAIERETKRKEKLTKRERSVNEAPPNQEPRTKNHKPLTNNQETRVKKRFAPPTAKEIKIFCGEKGYLVDPERFFHFYESKNWMVGKNKMKSWHSALAGWNAKEKSKAKKVDLYNTTAPDGWVTEMRDDPLNNHIFEDEK